MKKLTSTLTLAIICLYASAQVGALDPLFNSTGTPGYSINSTGAGVEDKATSISLHSDGRIVVATYITEEFFTVARYLSTGVLDPAFGTGGIVSLRRIGGDNAASFAVKVLPDNTILVAGFDFPSSKDFAILKLLENGNPDVGFGTLGTGWVLTDFTGGNDEAHAMAVNTADGSIVLAGYSTNSGTKDFAVAKYTSAGVLDPSFGGGKVSTNILGNDEAESISIQADGKIVIGGTSDENGDPNFTVVRYLTDGTLDGGFGSGGIATFDLANGGVAASIDEGQDLAVQPDGKILLTGLSKANGANNHDVGVIRLTSGGLLDGAFNATGTTGTTATPGIITFNHGPTNSDEGSYAISLQSNGKILLAGDTDGTGSTFAMMLLRFNSNGTFDTNFDGDGVATYDIPSTPNDFGYAMILNGNRIYLAGTTGSPKDLILAAIQNDGAPLPLVLSSFYAQKQTSKVVLQWQTSSEEGVKQFVIERSNDGKTYKAIGQVAATGNSTLTKNYSFADQSPFMSANNYYRLLMQDIDGNYKYSKTLIIKYNGQLSTNMQVFPSPVKDLLQVQLPDGMKGTVGLQIIDLNGRIVRRNNLASDGNALNTTLDVSTLIKGVYILQAQAGSTTQISRFTKQ